MLKLLKPPMPWEPTDGRAIETSIVWTLLDILDSHGFKPGHVDDGQISDMRCTTPEQVMACVFAAPTATIYVAKRSGYNCAIDINCDGGAPGTIGDWRSAPGNDDGFGMLVGDFWRDLDAGDFETYDHEEPPLPPLKLAHNAAVLVCDHLGDAWTSATPIAAIVLRDIMVEQTTLTERIRNLMQATECPL